MVRPLRTEGSVIVTTTERIAALLPTGGDLDEMLENAALADSHGYEAINVTHIARARLLLVHRPPQRARPARGPRDGCRAHLPPLAGIHGAGRGNRG